MKRYLLRGLIGVVALAALVLQVGPSLWAASVSNPGVIEMIAGTGVTLSPSPCVSGTVCTISATGGVGSGGNNLQAGPLLEELPNDTSTGTAAGKIVKLTTGAKVRTVTTSDTLEGIGICYSGVTGDVCSTSGTAAIAVGGQVPCIFDGATTAGDWVIVSTTVAGDCHDSGSTTPPTGVSIMGASLTTNVSGGTYNVDLDTLGLTNALNKKINGCAFALTGDVTTSGSTCAATIANNAVTNAKAAQAAANTLKGNNTGVTANEQDLTVSQVNTMLGTATGTGSFTANDCAIATGSGFQIKDGGANNQIGSIAANCNFPTNTTAGSVANAGQAIYLLSSFRDAGSLNNGDQCLILQVSEDGQHWNTLTANSITYSDVISPAVGCGIRDPAIMEYNGKYWMAYSYAGSGYNGFGIASSSYLETGWTKVAQVDASACGNSAAWAPEWVHNPDGSPYMNSGLPAIIVATTDGATTTHGQPCLLTPTTSAMTAWNAGAAITSWPGHLTGGTAAEVSTTATLTYSGGQSYVIGQHVNVSGCSVSGYNGTAVNITAVTPTTFSYTTGSGLGAATGCVADVDAIDFYPVVSGGTFYLFGKDDGSATSVFDKTIFTVSGPSLTNYNTLVSWQSLGTFGSQDIEGPTVVQLANGSWEMIVDLRTDLGMQYSTASAITGSWSAYAPLATPMSYYNHGTMLRVMDANAQRNMQGAFAANTYPVFATLSIVNCTIANNAAGGEIPWATNACSGSTGTFTKVEDNGGFYNASNNTRLTAPSAGRYHACVAGQWAATSATGIRVVEIDLTNTYTSSTVSYGKLQDPGSTAAGPHQASCWDVTMNKGDYAQMGIFQNSGGTLVLSLGQFTITRYGGY